MAARLTHLDAGGRLRMVDVSVKPETRREARAACLVQMSPSTRRRLLSGGLVKGDALAAARLAGIMAAKRTADLIPLAHPLQLSHCGVHIATVPGGLEVTATAAAVGKTGVELEALTAAAVAALTLYDMAKAVERGMRITDLRLIFKSGGRSGTWRRRNG